MFRPEPCPVSYTHLDVYKRQGFDGIAYFAARELVLQGRTQPSGYTEPVLHARRLQLKAQSH